MLQFQRSAAAQKASPEKAAQTNVQLAIEYMKLNKLSSSRDFIERALKEDPGNANVQFTAGLVYERLQETRKAERAYSSAARIGKNDPNIQNGYAGFLCRTGKTTAGEKLFDEVARDPLYQTPEVALVNAGVCVRSTGDMVDAKKYFNRALALRPNLPEAMLELGNLALDQGEAAEALDYVTRYLAVNQADSGRALAGIPGAAQARRQHRGGGLCPPDTSRISRIPNRHWLMRSGATDERDRAIARTSGSRRSAKARNEQAEGRRRNASRFVGHRRARGRRLSAHRSRPCMSRGI